MTTIGEQHPPWRTTYPLNQFETLTAWQRLSWDIHAVFTHEPHVRNWTTCYCLITVSRRIFVCRQCDARVWDFKADKSQRTEVPSARRHCCSAHGLEKSAVWPIFLQSHWERLRRISICKTQTALLSSSVIHLREPGSPRGAAASKRWHPPLLE